MPEESLAVLQKIYEHQLSNIGLNFTKLSTVRFWDSPTHFNAILSKYYNQCCKSVEELLKIQDKKCLSSFTILKKENKDNKKELKKINSCKSVIDKLKKECLDSLNKLKIKLKLVPFMAETFSLDERFKGSAMLSNLNSWEKIEAHGKENMINIDSIFNKDLKEYLEKFVLLLSFSV